MDPQQQRPPHGPSSPQPIPPRTPPIPPSPQGFINYREPIEPVTHVGMQPSVPRPQPAHRPAPAEPPKPVVSAVPPPAPKPVIQMPKPVIAQKPVPPPPPRALPVEAPTPFPMVKPVAPISPKPAPAPVPAAAPAPAPAASMSTITPPPKSAPTPFHPPAPLVPTPQFVGMPGNSAPDHPTSPQPKAPSEVPPLSTFTARPPEELMSAISPERPKPVVPPPPPPKPPTAPVPPKPPTPPVPPVQKQPYRPFPAEPFTPPVPPIPTAPSEPSKPDVMTAVPQMPTRPPGPSGVPRQFTGGESPLPPLSRPGLNIPQTPARGHHGGRWLSAFLILIVLLAGGAYAAYAFVLNPAIALPTAVDALDAAPMLHSEILVNVDSDNPQISGSTITVDSDTDKSGSSPARQLAVDIEAPTVSLAGEVRIVGETFYGELTRVPSQYAAQYSSVIGKWYSASLDSLKTYSSSYASMLDTSTHLPAFRTSFDALAGSGIFATPSFTGFGFVEGKPVRTYSTTINMNALNTLLSGAGAAHISMLSGDSGRTLLSSLGPSPIVISTDILSGALRQIKTDLTIKLPQSQISSASSVTLHITATFDPTANAPVAVPDGAISEDANIAQAMKASQAFAINEKIRSDIVQTAADINAAHKTTYAGLCRKAPGAAGAMADLESIASSAVCRDSTRAYLITAPILPTAANADISYMCADSTGKQTTLATMPSGYVCK